MTALVRRGVALGIAPLVLVLALTGCGVREQAPAADPSGSATSGDGAAVAPGDAPGTASTSPSPAVIGEDAIDTVEDALDSATTVADQVEQELAQDEEG